MCGETSTPRRPARSAAAAQDRPGALPGQRAAADVEEQRPRDAARPPAASAGRARTRYSSTAPQRVAADRDDPLLAALAGQPHRRPAAVEVVDGQPDRLGDARAGAVQQLQQRAVAQPARPSSAPAARPAPPPTRTGIALGSRRAGVGGRPRAADVVGRRARRAARTGAGRGRRPPPGPPTSPTAAGGRRRPARSAARNAGDVGLGDLRRARAPRPRSGTRRSGAGRGGRRRWC